MKRLELYNVPNLMEVAFTRCRNCVDVKRGLASFKDVLSEWLDNHLVESDEEAEMFDRLASDALSIAIDGNRQKQAEFQKYMCDGIWGTSNTLYEEIYMYYLRVKTTSQVVTQIAEGGQD